jgi:hypothetical protein
MTAPDLKIVGKIPMSNANPSAAFFLIVADQDRGFFCIEGPMTDDRRWQDSAREARNNGRKVACGPSGPDRDTLAADYQRTHKLAGVPPGSIMRPWQ